MAVGSLAKKGFGFLRIEPGQKRGFPVSCLHIGCLYATVKIGTGIGFEAKTEVDSLLKFPFERFVILSDCGFERRNKVADHVLRGVVQQGIKLFPRRGFPF